MNYDLAAMRFYDIAHEGAQVRSIASQLSDPLSGRLEGMDARSLTVLVQGGLSIAACRWALALLEPHRVPITVARTLPNYVGPLDVVLVISEGGAEPELEQAVSVATARGSEVIVVAPANSPLESEASSSVYFLPALPGVEAPSPARACAAVWAIAQLLQGRRECAVEQLELLADAMDAELAQVAPDRDPLVNPAFELSLFAEGAQVIHTGDSPVTCALAEVISYAWTASGRVSAHLDTIDLAQAQAARPASADDLFRDPYLDDAPAVLPLKIVVWGPEQSGWPNSRAQSVETAPGHNSSAIEQTMLLLVRGLAVTALPADDGRND